MEAKIYTRHKIKNEYCIILVLISAIVVIANGQLHVSKLRYIIQHSQSTPDQHLPSAN